MPDYLFGLMAIGAVILIAAFLGSWLAGSLNARRHAVAVPAGEDTNSVMPPTSRADLADMKHTFEFDDDRITMIVDMPVTMLTDDALLADAWVDVVGWARVAWADAQAHHLAAGETEGEAVLDPNEITSEHMADSLQRLHDAAERRRELRQKLAQQSSAPSQPIQETSS